MLRDHLGKILCVFAAHLGTKDVLLTELLAILRACELFGSCQELNQRPLTIISDSLTAVKWIQGCFAKINSHDQTIKDIRFWLGSFSSAVVEFRPRSTNSLADTLAKKGLDPYVEVLSWSVS